MSLLNHVKMWTKRGYEPTTVKEADVQHPGGTVTAASGFFICDLCGQYVTFTARGAYARHFRHNSKEDEWSMKIRMQAWFYGRRNLCRS